MLADVSASSLNLETTLLATFPDLASDVLELVMRHRRTLSGRGCASSRCAHCFSPHLERVLHSIRRQEPVMFVLPAFPGKSPNPAKVLGTRPDMAERQSLAFLNHLCNRIQKIYAPGARIVLCSDGRVFNDVVGIEDADITVYQAEISALIQKLGAINLTTFNLDDIFGKSGFEVMRSHLMTGYGDSLEALQSEVRAGGDASQMYCGITRFLFEDALRPGMPMSKTALQKECRLRAYEVIRRSRAWDKLLASYFPRAVRLSIHPQACGSRKIGIHLLETDDAWLTAWHSVAVNVGGSFRLMKRKDVEALGAELIFENGRPSHYEMRGVPE